MMVLLMVTFHLELRVQDDIISLNKADCYRVHAIYESIDVNDPASPTLTISNATGPSGNTNDLVIGEVMIGNLSNAKAVLLEKNSSSSISFAYRTINNSKMVKLLLLQLLEYKQILLR